MKIKTLVVDNNPVILKAVSSILTQEGCEVKSVATGLEALEVLDNFSPDIVFTDLVMPLVSGEQLCRIIRNTEKYQNIFVVVLSGIVLEDKERILRDVDCDVCIAKGSLSEIRKHIREALHAFNLKDDVSLTLRGTDTRIPEGLKPSHVALELLLEKRHHKKIISNLDEGILELNDEGKVVAANPAVLKMLSCGEETIIGKPLPEIRDWGTFSDDITSWARDQLVGRGMAALEIYEDTPLLWNDKVISTSMIPVRDEDMVFGLCIFRDISRQFKAEKRNREINEAIRLAKKMDAMSCMAGGVAHDFNNLLTVICGNLDILLLEAQKNSTRDEKPLIEQAKKAALVAVDLTRQISCFSNFGIVKREAVEADILVKQAVETFFKNELKESCEFMGNSGTTLVSVDPEEIILAVSNVLRNSREATDGGKITISVENRTLKGPELIAGQYVSAGDYVCVDIEDRGPGIDGDQIYKIFDPYYSTKERGASKGVGLGLTVVYATLRNHGGNVIVTSTKGKGTKVTMFIPVFVEAGMSDIISYKSNVWNRAVLLVDSDNQMREIGKIMLKHLGFQVSAVSNRKEAVYELKRDKADGEHSVSLVVLDLSDVTGESAIETCKVLRELDPELKIIAMCGTVLDPIMADYESYGFDTSLPKPFTMDTLRHVAHTVLST